MSQDQFPVLSEFIFGLWKLPPSHDLAYALSDLGKVGYQSCNGWLSIFPGQKWLIEKPKCAQEQAQKNVPGRFSISIYIVVESATKITHHSPYISHTFPIKRLNEKRWVGTNLVMDGYQFSQGRSG